MKRESGLAGCQASRVDVIDRAASVLVRLLTIDHSNRVVTVAGSAVPPSREPRGTLAARGPHTRRWHPHTLATADTCENDNDRPHPTANGDGRLAARPASAPRELRHRRLLRPRRTGLRRF